MSGSDAIIDPALRDVAGRLASAAGRGRVSNLSRLAGGKNNQVYRVDLEGSEPLVLKRYFSDPRDPRDRLAAEWGFLQHAWSRGVRTIPQPLASELASRTGLYTFVPGRKLGPSEIGAPEVDAAIDFVLAVNGSPRDPLALAPGSEACFSLAEHLDTVERRVARLRDLDPEAPYTGDARRFVAEMLLPTWIAARKRIAGAANAAGLSFDKRLRPEDCCLSPSDFGFHNALSYGADKLTFLDFEYAGRDDPAKLVSDFFCQPEIPVPLSFHGHFVTRLADGLGLDEGSRTRCRILLDAYRIKWTCIILNDFLPLGAARRAFADAGLWAARCATQLAMAQANVAGMAA
ncbi:phosphotransferase [Bradyrhizobium sp.]|uniref:phosphotransferase n=1 Tax=Bradyrhizobium sp. TaxID=376 RepID=UPI004037D538